MRLTITSQITQVTVIDAGTTVRLLRISAACGGVTYTGPEAEVQATDAGTLVAVSRTER